MGTRLRVKAELTGRSRRGRRHVDLLLEPRKHAALSSVGLSGLRIPQARPEPKTQGRDRSPEGQEGNQQIGAVHEVILSPRGVKSGDGYCLNQGTLARKPESTPTPKCIRRFAAHRYTIEDPESSIQARAKPIVIQSRSFHETDWSDEVWRRSHFEAYVVAKTKAKLTDRMDRLVKKRARCSRRSATWAAASAAGRSEAAALCHQALAERPARAVTSQAVINRAGMIRFISPDPAGRGCPCRSVPRWRWRSRSRAWQVGH